jgi:CDP-paratose 2-epimerase
MSTNKVYGDSPNRIPLAELETRLDYSDPTFANGIPEILSIDQSKHSLFGTSKVAADILVQEHGRCFGIPTCCLRGGCLTGPNHSGVQLHGFLSYLIKCNLENREHTVFGYKGSRCATTSTRTSSRSLPDISSPHRAAARCTTSAAAARTAFRSWKRSPASS